MEEVDKGCPMIRMGVSGSVFLWVPAYLGSPGPKAVKRCVCVRACVRACVCSETTHLRCGGVVSNQIKKGLLLSLSVNFF